MNYCPKHDAGDLLTKAGFYPKKGRGYVKDLDNDRRLHALLNLGVIEMHLDFYEPMPKNKKLKRQHKSSKTANQVNNIIQKLRNIDNLKFFDAYQEFPYFHEKI